MIGFALRRFLGALFSLWAVLTVVFFTLHLLPGDPVNAALSQSAAPPAVIEQRRVDLGLDRPLPVQYIAYMSALLQGHWGISWSSGQAVELLVFGQVLPTLFLAISSMSVAIILGFLWGYGSAVSRLRVVEWICDLIISTALATPVMLSGIVLIWLFAIHLDWMPATGQDGILPLTLPSLAVGFCTSGGTGRSVSASLRSVLSEPYMQFARAKGLSFHQAVVRHAFRAALPSILSILAVQFGYLAAGTVIAESIFARQGLGRLLLHAVLNQDLPVVRAIVFLTAATYIIINLIADLFQSYLDPRVRSA